MAVRAVWGVDVWVGGRGALWEGGAILLLVRSWFVVWCVDRALVGARGMLAAAGSVGSVRVGGGVWHDACSFVVAHVIASSRTSLDPSIVSQGKLLGLVLLIAILSGNVGNRCLLMLHSNRLEGLLNNHHHHLILSIITCYPVYITCISHNLSHNLRVCVL